MRTLLCLVPGLLLLAAGGLGAADPKKTDKDKIQGLWKLVQELKDDKEYDINETSFDFFHLRFKGDKVTVELKDSKEEATYKLDPSKKPRRIDLKPTTGEYKGKTLLGIYELDGDKLKLYAANEPGDDRPTEFKSSDDKNVVYILERVKK
jgi:uncharacterized protein (TIGR03067 family)